MTLKRGNPDLETQYQHKDFSLVPSSKSGYSVHHFHSAKCRGKGPTLWH